MSETSPREGGAPQAPVRRPLLALFTSHWLAMLGVGLVLTAIVLWSCLLTAELRHGEDNPYIGVAMLGVGGVLVLGLLLTPLGLYLGRRRLQRQLGGAQIDRRTLWTRLIGFLLVTSLINVAIVSQTSVRAVHAMESRQFCGSCHVMTPESRAIDQGPHAGLLCVDCHVGDGALGFFKSKIQGTKQLMSVINDSVHMPIEGAIETGRMIPSAQTCEQCHWKTQLAKATLKMIRSYADDEANTPETTLLTMNVGGERMGGIHGAHHGEGITVRFVASDSKRLEIPLVEYEDSKRGVRRTYVKQGVDAAQFAGQPRITMECIDCHNRPAHAFEMPDRAVDRALMLGRMSATLPFLKKQSVAILQAGYASSEDAAAKIPRALAEYYEKSHPDVARSRGADVAQAGEVLADLYSRNVFPELGVDWGTYPDFRGHQSSPGCLRCHAGEHTAADGESITKNCFRCHFPSAVGEAEPEILDLLGVDPMLRDLQRGK